MPPLVSVFPTHFRASSHTEPKPIVFSIRNPLDSHKPVTDQSTTKSLQNSPKLLFSVKTHYNSSLQQKLRTILNLEDPYLRATSSVILSPTQSSFIKILSKHDFSFRAQTGLSAVGKGGLTNVL